VDGPKACIAFAREGPGAQPAHSGALCAPRRSERFEQPGFTCARLALFSQHRMSDANKPRVNWKGLAIKALAAVGGGVGLSVIGLAYSRIGGT
jgi:hypothetical protein